MTYEAFLELTKKNIKRFLPEPFQEGKVEIRESLKNNSIRRHGVCVTNSQRNKLVPVLYLENYYQELEQGKGIEDIWQEIAQDYRNYQKEEVMINGTPIREWDYETIKGRLSVCVRNAEENREFLKTHPHEIQEDLALIYCFDVEMNGGINGTITVDHDKLKWLGVSEEQLKRDAWANMKHREPPCFFALDDVMGQLYFGEAIDTEKKGLEHLDDVDPNAMMYVLTNSNQVNGAVYMCDKEVLSLIAEQLGADLIVIPSSIHETIILKDTQNMSLSELNAMVEAVNAEAVAPQERLGNSVYLFDRGIQKLEKAEEQVEEQSLEAGLSPVLA